MIRLAVCNFQGGSGKTTTAVNLAAVLAERRRTLLVDLDHRGHATTAVGHDRAMTKATLAEVISGAAMPRDAVHATDVPGLFVLPGGDLDVLGRELGCLPDPEQRLAWALAEYADFERIVMDLPAGGGIWHVNALVAANRVIVPVPATYLGTDGLVPQVMELSRVLDEFNAGLVMEGAVPTFELADSKVSKMVGRVIADNMGPELTLPGIPFDAPLMEAPCYGEPITVYAPTSAGALHHRRLARTLDARWQGAVRVMPRVEPGPLAA